MPWTAAEFKKKHNQKATTAEAGRAAKQAWAMIQRGVPEGEAIATANAEIARRRKHGKMG